MKQQAMEGTQGQRGVAGPSSSKAIPSVAAIIMAAGVGKRMRSKLAKVLHPIAGRPMILFAIELAERVAGKGTTVVVGHQGEQVKALVQAQCAAREGRSAIRLVDQGQPLGTGHAVLQATRGVSPTSRDAASAYLILNGDTPLLSEATVRELWRLHEAQQATITLLTAMLDDPTGYGRVVRSDTPGLNGGARPNAVVSRIVEDRDADEREREIREVNVGTYLIDARFLVEALDKIQPRNVQKEYYLTDLVGMAVERGLRVSALTLHDFREGLGINSRQQLATAEQVVRQQIATRWLAEGVTMRDPATTWIDADVTIGSDSVLYPHVTLEGKTQIGEDCVIRSHVRLTDCWLGNRVLVQDCCVARESRLEEDATIGPFTHLRPGAVVRRRAKVGNFVEMKQADLGEGSKANHLTYLGNAKIGKKVNIGAGTVTCNYDGVRKYETVIEDEAFLGSNTLLVAPVTVGRGSLVAAGSTVTQDVPEDALAIARASQLNRPGWAAKRRALPAPGEVKAPETLKGTKADKSGSRAKRKGMATKRKR